MFTITLKTVEKVFDCIKADKNAFFTVNSIGRQLNANNARVKAVFEYLEKEGKISKVPNSADIMFYKLNAVAVPQTGDLNEKK